MFLSKVIIMILLKNTKRVSLFKKVDLERNYERFLVVNILTNISEGAFKDVFNFFTVRQCASKLKHDSFFHKKPP